MPDIKYMDDDVKSNVLIHDVSIVERSSCQLLCLIVYAAMTANLTRMLKFVLDYKALDETR